VKRLGRGDLLIADTDAAGLVTQVEHRAAEATVTLFKIQPSFHANFSPDELEHNDMGSGHEIAEVPEMAGAPG
jgi:hypothetical protein